MEIRTNKGDRLHYVITEKGTSDLALVCHGMMCTAESFFYPALCDGLEMSSVRFDFAGNGGSEGVFDLAGYEDEADQIEAVRMSLAAAGRNVTLLIGHSKAASSVVIHSSKYGTIPHIVSIAGKFTQDTEENPHILRLLPQVEAEGSAVFEAPGMASFTITAPMIADRRALDMTPYVTTV
jgi:alpha/beta superfamily hydrolase